LLANHIAAKVFAAHNDPVDFGNCHVRGARWREGAGDGRCAHGGRARVKNKKRRGVVRTRHGSMHCVTHDRKFASALATALQRVTPNGRMPDDFHNQFSIFAIFIHKVLRNQPCKSGLS
jgi:hypothetical protein